MEFFDTHAHLDFPDFKEEVVEVIERARVAGITRIVCIGTDLESSERAIALSEAHEACYAVVGWHPGDVADAPEDLRTPLRELVRHPRVVAIGETSPSLKSMNNQGTSKNAPATPRATFLPVASSSGSSFSISVSFRAISDVNPSQDRFSSPG